MTGTGTGSELDERLRAALVAVADAVARADDPLTRYEAATPEAAGASRPPPAVPAHRTTARPRTRPRHAPRRRWAVPVASAALVGAMAIVGVAVLRAPDREPTQPGGPGAVSSTSAATGSTAAVPASDTPSPFTPSTATTTLGSGSTSATSSHPAGSPSGGGTP